MTASKQTSNSFYKSHFISITITARHACDFNEGENEHSFKIAWANMAWRWKKIKFTICPDLWLIKMPF